MLTLPICKARRLFCRQHLFRFLLACGALVALQGCVPSAAEPEPVMPEVEIADERLTSFAVRGWGSVYLMPDPGLLEIVVEKQDLNRFAGADILVARLLGPDREEIAVARFPDDGNAEAGGGAGPVQRAVLQTEVSRRGLYKLDLEARTGQELGHDIVWGISTNASKFAVESLLSFMLPGEEGEIYFYPMERDFEVQVRGIGSQQEVPLFDAAGSLVETFDTRNDSEITRRVRGAGDATNQPWRLHLEEQRASIRIEGVTHLGGDAEDYYPHFGYWSPVSDSLFRVEEVRWLITPSQVAVHSEGRTVRIPFVVRNGSRMPAEFSLALDAPANVDARIEGAKTFQLGSEETVEVTVVVEARELQPGSEEVVTIEVASGENPGMAGYASIRLRGGSSPAADPIHLPLVLEPYRHENMLLGYHPDYVPNVPYFDRENRPYFRSRRAHRHHSPGLEVLGAEGWRHANYMDAVAEAVPDVDHAWFASYRLANKISFDTDGDAYTLLSVTRQGARVNDRQALLLHSADRGRSFTAHPLGEISDATFELEQFTGHNDDSRPPAVLLYTRVADHPARWAWLNRLKLYLPEKDSNGELVMGDPIDVSDRALNPAAHSGGGSALATYGDLTFIVWGEAVDPSSDVPGVPSYISVYDRSTGELGEKVFLAHAPPINDSHNSPAIVMDSQGYLHVVVGAHGRPFQYLRSAEPLRIDAGWSEPVPVLSTGRIEIGAGIPERGAQTYVGLVATPDDTLHLVSRQWREGVDDYHDGHLYAALSYQRKRPGGEWEEPVPLVVPPLPDYSVFYHKLSIDRLGRLYLTYNYYSTHEHYRKDIPGRLNYQAVMMSEDGGDTWKMATTADFQNGLTKMEGTE